MSIKQYIITLDGDEASDEESVYFDVAASALGNHFSIQVREFLNEREAAVEPDHHKAEPEVSVHITYRCKGCLEEIKQVTGGHGPVWVHARTGVVVGENLPVAPGITGEVSYCYVCGRSEPHDFRVCAKNSGAYDKEEEQPIVTLMPFDMTTATELLGDDFMNDHEWLSDKDWQEVFDLAAAALVEDFPDRVREYLQDEVAKFNPPEPSYD